jgi:carboxylesterase
MSINFSFKHIFSTKTAKNSSQAEGIDFKGSNGSAVILIHGLTGTPNEMAYLAASLNRKGYSVVCPLLANHGKPLEILRKTTWQDCYNTIRQILIGLLSRYTYIFVSGLSMGATLALVLAIDFPQEVSGVSCLSPTLFYDGWNVPWIQHLLPLVCLTHLKYQFYFKEEPPYGIKNEAIRERVHNHYSTAKLGDIEGVAQFGYPYIPVSLIYEPYLLAKYLNKRLKKIKTPVQLIQAKNDDMTSIKNSQFIYERISSGMKELVLLHNCYHLISIDQERKTVAQEVESFFSRIRAL